MNKPNILVVIRRIFNKILHRINTLFFELNKSRKVIFDVILASLPQIVNVVTSFVSSILIGRGLGPIGMGNFTLIQSLSNITTSFSDLGIGQIAIRYASRAVKKGNIQEEYKILRWAFRLRIAIVFFATILMFLLVPYLATTLWHNTKLIPLLRLGLVSGVFSAFAAVPMIYFKSNKRFDINSKILVAQTLITFSGILLISIINKWSVISVVSIILIATAIGTIIFLFFIPRDALIRSSEVYDIFRRKINFFDLPVFEKSTPHKIDKVRPNNFSKYMMASSLFVIITMQMDVWLIGKYLPASQIGIYGMAKKFSIPLNIILASLTTALWPRISTIYSKESLVINIKKIFKFSIPLMIFCIFYSSLVPFTIPILLGVDYKGAELLAFILCFRYVIAIAINPISLIGYNFGLVRLYTFVNAFQLMIVIFLNIIFLPKIGVLTAALGLIINDIVGGFIIGAKIYKLLKEEKELKPKKLFGEN